MKRLLTAAQIAELKLPGLPATKAAILVRAAREGWYVEEATGLGGRRKVFQVPDAYLRGLTGPREPLGNLGGRPEAPSDKAGQGHAWRDAADYVKKARAQGEITDAELIQEIVVGVERWLERNRLNPPAEKKAALISLLFKYFQTEGAVDEEKLDQLLKAVA